MTEDALFAARIEERYPEGLTGILAIGGTRTAYILERRRFEQDPGQIGDFQDYVRYALGRYMALMGDFFVLGGKYLVIPPLSHQAFYERGEEYTRVLLTYTPLLTGEQMVDFYHRHNVDPFFVGIDTLLQLPKSQAAHKLGAELQAFQENWEYDPSRRKVIWEIAPIPLYSFWRAQQTMPLDAQQALEIALRDADDMRVMYKALFTYYARAALGTEIPVPHFYVGTNRKGDLKLRSMIPIALLAGGGFRMFFLPYPSLMMTKAVLRAILEDLAFSGPAHSKAYDYSGRYTSADAQQEYQRVQELVADPQAVVGMLRDRR